MFSKFSKWFNKNTYVYAVLMILLNVGSKYIEIDLDETHKNFLSSTFVRRLMIFTVAFIATKDIMTSFIITAISIIFVLNLLLTSSLIERLLLENVVNVVIKVINNKMESFFIFLNFNMIK